MFKDTSEPSTGISYPQNLELIGFAGSITPQPADFRSSLQDGAGDTYPKDVIEHMQADGYNPVMIGYTHGSSQEVERIQSKLSELQDDGDKPLSVLLEITPQQLGWIKDFLGMEQSLKATGMIHGNQPRPDEAQRMTAYRQQLRRNHGEALAVWCLDAGMDVEAIEHPDVQGWINQDRLYYAEEDEWSWLPSRAPREFTTAIRRDINGLKRMDEVRPDVVLVGYIHALKYDALMDRDGQNTYYYLSMSIPWQEIQTHWVEAHRDGVH
jgi:hypothetical protein